MNAKVIPFRKGVTRKTARTVDIKTVDGVKLVRCDTGWRVDNTMIGLEYNETGRCWDVYGTLELDAYARTLGSAVRKLRAAGHIPPAPNGAAS